MALWQMHSSWKHHLSLLMLFDVLPLLFLNDWKCKTLTPDSCVGFLIALPVLCNAKFLLICMWRLFLPPSFPLVLPGFYSKLEYLFKECVLSLGGVWRAIKSSLLFSLPSWWSYRCWWHGYWDDDSVEIYHNLRHCFTRGFETDGSIGFKT